MGVFMGVCGKVFFGWYIVSPLPLGWWVGKGYNDEKFQGEWKIVDNIAIGLFIFCFIECLFPYLCGVIT